MSYRLARNLALSGNEVTVCVNEIGQDDPSLQEEPFALRRAFPARPGCSMRRPVGFLRVMLWQRRSKKAIRRVVAEVRPDVILTGNYNALFQVARKAGCPYAVYLHGEDIAAALYTSVPGRKRRMRKFLRDASWIFCNSRYSASLLPQMAGRQLADVSATGCGVQPEDIVDGDHRREARAALQWSDDARVIITVSRLVYRKGIDTVILAMPRILQASPNAQYVVVGDGPDRAAFEALAEKTGVADHVKFTGFVSSQMRRDIYLASDVYVMPSRPGEEGEVEGFGISFLEANAHGLPVIGSRVGGIPDAISDGVNGMLVEPQDQDQLADSIIHLLENPDIGKKMAEAGKKRIRERFNWNMICEDVESRLRLAVQQHSFQGDSK